MQEVKTLGEHGGSSCIDRSDVAGLPVMEVMDTGHISGFSQIPSLQRISKGRPDGPGFCPLSGPCGLLYPLKS